MEFIHGFQYLSDTFQTICFWGLCKGSCELFISGGQLSEHSFHEGLDELFELVVHVCVL